MVPSPNCAKIKSVASNQNSPGGNAAKKLLRIPRHHEFKNSPKRDPNYQRNPNYQEIQTTKRSKMPRCQESKGSLKRSKGPRDP